MQQALRKESIRNVQIEGAKGRPILVDIFYRQDGIPKPVIIFCHGFKGFKDWGPFNQVGDYFAEQEFVFFKFNFSHNGTTPDKPSDFDDLEAFGNNNFSLELEDLGHVIDWALETLLVPDMQINKEELYLVGHSRGGGIVIIKAAEDIRVKKIATWASVKDFAYSWDDDKIKAWKERGILDVPNLRTGQVMPLNYQLYEDYKKHQDRFDILQKTARLQIPFLVVHGTEDESVPFEHALALKRANQNIKLDLIPDGSHTFNTGHPATAPRPSFEMRTAMEHTAEFFKAGSVT